MEGQLVRRAWNCLECSRLLLGVAEEHADELGEGLRN